MKKETRIRIFHLSDLHIMSDSLNEFKAQLWYDLLAEDLKYCSQQEQETETFVVISGDLTHSGKPSEFKVAVNILRQFLKAVKAPDRNLILVPGNHDILSEAPLRHQREAFFECARKFAFKGEDSTKSLLRKYDEQQVIFLMPGAANVSNEKEAIQLENSVLQKLKSPKLKDHLRIVVTHYPLQKYRYGIAESDQEGPYWTESVFSDCLERSSPHFILHGNTRGAEEEEAIVFLGSTEHRRLSINSGPLSSETWRRASSGPPLYRILNVTRDKVDIQTRVYLAQSARWIDRRAIGFQVGSGVKDIKPLLQTDRKTLRQKEDRLVDELCELREFEMADLTTTLGVAIENYLPLRESREEFARRLVTYFSREKSLDYLDRCIYRWGDSDRNRKIRIFLTAATAGIHIANSIANLCEEMGAEVWFAEKGISKLGATESEIVHAIQDCDIFLAIVTPDFITSNWAIKEVGIALQQSDGVLAPRIASILVKGSQLPDTLQGIEAVKIEKNDDINPKMLSKVLRPIN